MSFLEYTTMVKQLILKLKMENKNLNYDEINEHFKSNSEEVHNYIRNKFFLIIEEMNLKSEENFLLDFLPKFFNQNYLLFQNDDHFYLSFKIIVEYQLKTLKASNKTEVIEHLLQNESFIDFLSIEESLFDYSPLGEVFSDKSIIIDYLLTNCSNDVLVINILQKLAIEDEREYIYNEICRVLFNSDKIPLTLKLNVINNQILQQKMDAGTMKVIFSTKSISKEVKNSLFENKNIYNKLGGESYRQALYFTICTTKEQLKTNFDKIDLKKFNGYYLAVFLSYFHLNYDDLVFFLFEKNLYQNVSIYELDEILKISYIEFENIKKILLDERIQNKRDEYSYYQVEEYINLSFEQRLSLILDRDLMTERNIKSALSNILNNKKYTIEEKNKIFRDNSFFSYIDSVMLTELQNTFYIFPETLNYLIDLSDMIFA